ncbi:Cytochrome c oxidase subunit Vb [Penicillium canescens]|nr:Cytochrome c oxidase subunit Vb [Penicillium canescens]
MTHHYLWFDWTGQSTNHKRSGQSGFKLAQPQTSKLPLSCPKRPRHPPHLLQDNVPPTYSLRPCEALACPRFHSRPAPFLFLHPNEKKWAPKQEGKILTFDEIKVEDDLLPPGAKPGTIPTDLDQSTGLERLELIGKMQGIDIFDMRPLDASRKGTLEDPIIVPGAGDEQYAGCTGFPVDSHQVNWLTVSRERPIERCMECGNVVKLNYVGPEEDPHSRMFPSGYLRPRPRSPPPPHVEPKTFADYVKPEYWYR